MGRFDDKVRRSVKRAVDRFGKRVLIERDDGERIRFKAIRRLPTNIEVGAGPGRNVLFAFEWIVTLAELERIRAFCGENGLFNGENIIEADGTAYRLDKHTPYTAITGPDAGYRLLTVKIGKVDDSI